MTSPAAPRISIVTISFNQAQFLERTIRSVADQGYGGLEFIVVDPGSTDGSRDVIAAHRDLFADVILEPDKGPADGLNKGFAAATGDVFGFVNSDDILLPGALAAVAAQFADPGLSMVTADALQIDADDRVERPLIGSAFDPRRYLLGGAVVVQQSTFFRADLFREVGGFDPQNRLNWDTDLFIRMARAARGRIAYVPGYWSGFRYHADSITVNQRHAELRAGYAARYEADVLGRAMTRDEHRWRRLRHQGRWLSNPLGLTRLLGGLARARLTRWRVAGRDPARI